MDLTLKPEPVFRCGRYALPIGKRTYLMGILNVTPDSFSDGGRFMDPDAALLHAEQLIEDGADILDVGGESTRPDYEPVCEEEELRRVLPVIEGITRRFDCPVSIDTHKSSVAKAALSAGAVIVNDVTGLQSDEQMAQVAAEAGAGVIIMHNARLYRTKTLPNHEDIILSMLDFMRKSLTLAFHAGLVAEQLVLDPGLGFGVNTSESLALIRHLPELKTFGLPVLVGPSRKRFIGDVLHVKTDQRLMGTAAAVAVSIARGADMIRVHDVLPIFEIVKMADAICRESTKEESECSLHGWIG